MVVHRPGSGLDRLTPDNVHDLLFDDVLLAERARAEHDAFAGQLRAHGVVVHHFRDLLTQALDDHQTIDVPGLSELATIGRSVGRMRDKLVRSNETLLQGAVLPAGYAVTVVPVRPSSTPVASASEPMTAG